MLHSGNPSRSVLSLMVATLVINKFATNARYSTRVLGCVTQAAEAVVDHVA